MTHDFTTIYNLYHDAILRYCTCKLRNHEAGEDLTQETFLRFWQCLQHDEQILSERAFLYRIAHNLFIDQVRKRKEISLDQLREAGFEPSIDPWHETYVHLDVENPIRKLCAMPKPYKKVVYCRFVLGFPPAEIAAMTNETSNTVSVRIFRGLKLLRSLVEEDAKAKNFPIEIAS